MEFTPEQLEVISNLAACNYTVRQVAIYFGLVVNDLFSEYQDRDSVFFQNYERGRLQSSADIDMKLLELSKDGKNMTATAMFKKASKAAQLANLKDELFGIR